MSRRGNDGETQRGVCAPLWKHLEGLSFGEFLVNDRSLGIGSWKIEWALGRYASQHLGKLVINGKLLDKRLIFPVGMFLGNNPVVAEWFWDVVDMGLGSCAGKPWCHWVSDITSSPPTAPEWYGLPLWPKFHFGIPFQLLRQLLSLHKCSLTASWHYISHFLLL